MSKESPLPPPKLKVAPEPIPLPPLFWDPNDDQPKTLKAPIYMVWVSTKDKGGENVPLDCTPLDGLPEFPHQLSDKYPGVPFVELVARSDSGAVVARVTHRCRSAPTAAAPEQAARTGAPAGGGSLDALAIMQAINERTDRLMGMLISSKDSASAQIVDVIGKMSGARIADSQTLFETILKAKSGASGGGGEQKGELAAFLKGFGHAQSLIAAGQEDGGDEGESDFEQLASIAIKEFMKAKGQDDPRPRPRVVTEDES